MQRNGVAVFAKIICYLVFKCRADSYSVAFAGMIQNIICGNNLRSACKIQNIRRGGAHFGYLHFKAGCKEWSRTAPVRKEIGQKTAFFRQFFRSIRIGTAESVSDWFSMQTTLLTCQHGAGGGAWADLLETRPLEVRPPGQLLLLQDLVLDLRLLVELVEGVDNDGDGEGDDEDADDGATGADHLSWAQKNVKCGFKAENGSKVRFSPNHVLGVMSP